MRLELTIAGLGCLVRACGRGQPDAPRLPSAAHTSRPWRIHELAAGFQLEDVWALPTPGGPDDFPRLVERMVSFDPSRASSVTRALFAIRSAAGWLLRLDGADSGVGSRVPSLRDRMPAGLRDAPVGPDAPPFRSVFLLGDEWALELANQTVHGVLHLGWVPDGNGSYRGQLAILVKRNGLLGSVYMRAIGPFRHLIVYPAFMRQIEREWHVRAACASR